MCLIYRVVTRRMQERAFEVVQAWAFFLLSCRYDGDDPQERSRPVKAYTEYLTFKIPKRMDFLNITSQVEAAVKKSGVKEGILLCNT
jgi:hypothetical protein